MKRYLLIVLLLVLIPLTVKGQDDQTIVIRGFGNITNFNPILANDGASYQAYSLLWPLPFETDSFTGEPVPGLTTWTVSEDGLTYTFTIRDDAVWSDGTPITSNDMKWVIDAVQSDAVESVLKPNAELIESVNIIDDKTYEIVLAETNCAALSDIGAFRFLPSHRFAADFSDVETNEITTNPDISGGPYILEEWRPDEFQRFVANPTYWEGEPNIPVLINRVIGEQAVAIQALQAGEIDYTYLQGDLFQQLTNTENLQYEAFPQITVNFFSMNWADPTNPQAAYDEDGNPVEQTPHPIFSDVRVRQAVAMGYNKQDILDTLGENGGTRLIGVVAPSVTWAYHADLEPWPYDPEAAAALLEEAGWVDSDGDGVREKDGQRLAFTINYSDILLFFETTALVIQDQLGQIGFEVTLNKQEWANYLEETYFGQMYDATPMSNSGGTGGPPDPNEFTSLLLSTQDVPGGGGNNLASYVNPEVDELINQGRSVPGCGLEERAEIYRQIQQITHDDVAYDWTFTPNLYQIMNRRIGNFNPGPTWVFYGYTAHVEEWTIEGE